MDKRIPVMKCKWILMMLMMMLFSIAYGQHKSTTYLFVGSYTRDKPDRGIYVYTFNSKSGALEEKGAEYDLTNPSYIALSPNGKYLYACADTKLPDTGSVMAFKVDSLNGKLKFINRQSSGGDNPVYLSVHANSRFIVNANYTGGSVSVYTTNEDGSLNPSSQVIQFAGSSIITDRQEKPHIHSAVFSPACDYVFLPDLGSDKIWVFDFDNTKAQPLVLKNENIVKSVPGSGPRHFTFHPNGKFAYCIEELSGMVSAYSYAHGKLDAIQRIFSYSKLLDSYGGADIHVSPDGLFLYASNRLKDENTIAIFSIDPHNGLLKLVGHQKTFGDHPRNFTIDPTGKFLLVANKLTNNIIVFKRDAKRGLLKKTKTVISVPSPSCLQMRTYSKEQGARRENDKFVTYYE